MASDGAPHALLVDLNNFARYPTLSIGYLVAALRASDIDVRVLCPLNHGVHPVARERPERRRTHVERRLMFSTHPAVTPLHEVARAGRKRVEHRPNRIVLAEVARALAERRPDVLLLSAYLDHHPSVRALAALARAHGTPVLLGGPMFSLPDVADEWRAIPGLTAIVGGEVDLTLGAIVRTLLHGGDLTAHPGVVLPDGRAGSPAPSLRDLSLLPTPDFRDFPWHRYPARVVPVMASRGCSWGRCLFCSDVITANGRTSRARPAAHVLDEMQAQSERHATKDFICLDIKLNSDLATWRGLVDGFQDRLPGGRWIGTVHVLARGENGLTAEELRAARASGLTRISFGLETGSQRVNDSMAKGTSLERTAAFLRDAHEAGLSVRATTMFGFPGERAEDVRATVAFLAAHGRYLDRIRLNRFKAIPGTRFEERHTRRPERYGDLSDVRWDRRLARAAYRSRAVERPDYREAKRALLAAVHSINRRPLRDGAEVFDGLM